MKVPLGLVEQCDDLVGDVLMDVKAVEGHDNGSRGEGSTREERRAGMPGERSDAENVGPARRSRRQIVLAQGDVTAFRLRLVAGRLACGTAEVSAVASPLVFAVVSATRLALIPKLGAFSSISPSTSQKSQ